MKISRYFVLPALLMGTAMAQNPAAGLWTGEVTLKRVSEVHFRQTTGTTPTETTAPFAMRVLLHVDGSGGVILLKEAILMQTPGTAPVRVIVTQPNLISIFVGIVERNGKLTGRRFSTAGFPMSGDRLALTGSLNGGGPASGSMTIAADHPVNPFRHKDHPDLSTAGVAVTRAITLAVDAGDTAEDHRLTGTWSESMTGLHKDAIQVSGGMTLVRVSTVAALNNQ